jgi:hypothetical protein
LIKARNDFAPSKISDKIEVVGANLWDTKANAIIRRVRTLAEA